MCFEALEATSGLMRPSEASHWLHSLGLAEARARLEAAGGIEHAGVRQSGPHILVRQIFEYEAIIHKTSEAFAC